MKCALFHRCLIVIVFSFSLLCCFAIYTYVDPDFPEETSSANSGGNSKSLNVRCGLVCVKSNARPVDFAIVLRPTQLIQIIVIPRSSHLKNKQRCAGIVSVIFLSLGML